MIQASSVGSGVEQRTADVPSTLDDADLCKAGRRDSYSVHRQFRESRHVFVLTVQGKRSTKSEFLIIPANFYSALLSDAGQADKYGSGAVALALRITAKIMEPADLL